MYSQEQLADFTDSLLPPNTLASLAGQIAHLEEQLVETVFAGDMSEIFRSIALFIEMQGRRNALKLLIATHEDAVASLQAYNSTINQR